ncbi:hypothetical protein ACFQX8_22165 [Klenkia terrae]|uniref:hypothetical protein n=1 Tax=Klenkia terrae TaxID=1052259 RepID=UPI0036192EB5
MPGDVAALGALLELCLTGRRGDEPGVTPPVIVQPDLAALVRRARSTEPGTALSSVAAMAALLGDRPRSGNTDPHHAVRGDESESGWLRKLRDRRDAEDAAVVDRPAARSEAPVPLSPVTTRRSRSWWRTPPRTTSWTGPPPTPTTRPTSSTTGRPPPAGAASWWSSGSRCWPWRWSSPPAGGWATT